MFATKREIRHFHVFVTSFSRAVTTEKCTKNVCCTCGVVLRRKSLLPFCCRRCRRILRSQMRTLKSHFLRSLDQNHLALMIWMSKASKIRLNSVFDRAIQNHPIYWSVSYTSKKEVISCDIAVSYDFKSGPASKKTPLFVLNYTSLFD